MVQVNENEYRLKFFLNNNYNRKICQVCQTPFWTKDKERNVCADIPCTDYYFFDLNIKSPPLTVREARQKFLKFFEKKGHTIIPPKPVLARWREDLYLTIASIVDFQPFVTSGIVPPPANPLVLSQPCIRLEDVDNVGVTFGRHLTTFEMAAHHAFNYPDKQIYWKDETVELSKEFFVEEIGIPEEELNYKESWWEGGGNAGPSFEVTVGGLELATLVFMQYEIKDGNYVPLKLKIVDTGYGVERIAWFTQKTPTAFHAIYGNLVYTFFNKIGAPLVDDELLKTAAILAGRIDPDKPETIKRHREEVAKKLGLDLKYVDQELTRAARVFQVLDHTKTIALMLADGLVPSNSGEGYLGRLLIRRALRVLRLLGSDIKLYELVKEQIEYWKEDFPQLLKNKDYILDVVNLEQERFNETLSKISLTASSLSRRKEISVDDLVKLYDSNGIPPDLLVEEIRKINPEIKVEVPYNFYGLVAKRHQTVPLKDTKKEKLPKDVIDLAENLPPTKKLYYEDQYKRSFTAKVVSVYKNYLVLDQTTFYPEGGGQIGDTGIIKDEKGNTYQVVDTQKVKDVIFHILDKEPSLKEGDEVYGEIDWQRRYRIMKHHTVTHVILSAARKVLGEHVWQAGAEKTPQKGRLDITHYKLPTEEEIKKIEDLANYIINDRRSVRPLIINRTEAEMKYGVSIYAGGVPEGADVRLIEIKDWDIEGCGGTHLSNTSEIGALKIINVEKIQDGVIRLEYVAGDVVAQYARQEEDKLKEISRQLSTSPEQIEVRLKRFLEEYKEKEELLNQYRKMMLQEIENISKKETVNGVTIYIINLFDEELRKEAMRKLTMNQKSIVVNISNKGNNNVVEIATSNDLRVDKIIEALRREGGKGGGKGTYGSITTQLNVDKIVNTIKSTINNGI
ncbi:alanine--tRNA ligase [Sulfurisphaera tokodaii]|uniref:Alanine--tRNA ligase n=2 Tax=Sulfurisphaera tokodaii TaxID=111955 RepID=SYA_SULTO|nr:alanine--tRNA ligase [Sulfurisphaera tokodaii]Q971J4.1 RecName: Full=Alanine--tRNA ligase; AltName: Full=Alanyl-tRNA synthetase; Short=AlaRS [Sulfurisphaera tokodaii str. 7]BAK54541.1 alanyl-tRNA synthetase [Sulfurisphaera tokodaii str. 7]HII73759.1 alanine--tRNA ligase [Sulfurisphaera tokodaii]